MKIALPPTWVWLVLITVVTESAFAQEPAAPSTHLVQTELVRIEQARQQLEAQVFADETQCYRRFAVTGCLRDARTRQRVALADLRRQELALADLDRQRKGEEQLQQILEKTNPQAQQEALDRRTQALAQQQQRQALAAAKAADQRPVSPPMPDKNGEKEAARASQAQASIQMKKEFDAKLREAQERKASRAQEAAANGNSSVKPLPVPN